MLPDKRTLARIFGEPLGLDLRFDVALGDARDESVADKQPGAAREASRRLGRAALGALLTEVGDGADAQTLEFPNSRYSLTHSGDVALAVGDVSAGLAGIGVDLEIETSIMRQAARFFLAPGELRWLRSLDGARACRQLLRLWCTKEAVFKSNPENRGTLLGDYELVEPGAYFGEARSRDGRFIEYVSWCKGRTSVAVAVCR